MAHLRRLLGVVVTLHQYGLPALTASAGVPALFRALCTPMHLLVLYGVSIRDQVALRLDSLLEALSSAHQEPRWLLAAAELGIPARLQACLRSVHEQTYHAGFQPAAAYQKEQAQLGFLSEFAENAQVRGLWGGSGRARQTQSVSRGCTCQLFCLLLHRGKSLWW